MNIGADTSLYAIFGHPVAHSLSPLMHNASFRALGLNSVYLAFDILPENSDAAAYAIRVLGIKGVNITIPHKERIIPFLDELSQEARLIGAVNTVKNEDGRLIGYNTDVGGFLRATREDLGFEPRASRAAVLGAGGAARAVLSALCMQGASRIFVLNRTYERAKGLASEFKESFKKVSIYSVPLSEEDEVRDCLSGSDILVNATSAGMEGTGSVELPIEVLPKGAVVYDLVYKPHKTPLLWEAQELGYRASGGLSMLIYQGAESFKIWTGLDAPIDVIRSVLSTPF